LWGCWFSRIVRTACDGASASGKCIELAQPTCHVAIGTFCTEDMSAITLSGDHEMILERAHVRCAVHVIREGGLVYRGHGGIDSL